MSIIDKVSGLLKFSLGAGTTALAADLTLTLGTNLLTPSPSIQIRDPGGSNRNVLLPLLVGTNSQSTGLWYFIRNAGAANNLVVKDSTGVTTYATLTPGQWCLMFSSGTSAVWYVAASVADLVSLTLTGTLSAVAAAFTGRVTTTDGVASGTTRIVGGLLSAITATATLTATASETVLGSVSLPIGTIKAGTTIRYRAAVRVTGNVGADTLTLRTRLGATTLTGTAIMASAAVTMIANDIAIVEGVITGRAVPGATASVASSASGVVTASGTAASFGTAPAPSNFATNGVLLLEFTGQWSSNSGTNSASLYQFDALAEG